MITPEPKREPESVYENQNESYEPLKPDTCLETPKEIKYEANINNDVTHRFESPTQRTSEQNQLQNQNQNQRFEIQKQYEAKQRSIESNQNSFEASQRSFEANQRSFEANQRSFDRYEKPFEQRTVKDDVYQHNYVQTYRNEEVSIFL